MWKGKGTEMSIGRVELEDINDSTTSMSLRVDDECVLSMSKQGALAKWG